MDLELLMTAGAGLGWPEVGPGGGKTAVDLEPLISEMFAGSDSTITLDLLEPIISGDLPPAQLGKTLRIESNAPARYDTNPLVSITELAITVARSKSRGFLMALLPPCGKTLGHRDARRIDKIRCYHVGKSRQRSKAGDYKPVTFRGSDV
jgi:hypothetical protein